jgi:hypothetical protein
MARFPRDGGPLATEGELQKIPEASPTRVNLSWTSRLQSTFEPLRNILHFLNVCIVSTAIPTLFGGFRAFFWGYWVNTPTHDHKTSEECIFVTTGTWTYERHIPSFVMDKGRLSIQFR